MKPLIAWRVFRVLLAFSFVGLSLGCERTKKFKLEGHQGGVTSVAFSPDGKLLASASRDQTVKIWDMPAGTLRTSVPMSARGIALSPDGTTLATADSSKVQFWDTTSGKPKGERVMQFAGDEPDWGPECVAFSPDGQWLASGGNNWIALEGVHSGIAVWSVADQSAPPKWHTKPGNSTGASCLAFSPDGTLLAAGFGRITEKIGKSEGHVELYDAATGNRVETWSVSESAAGEVGRTAPHPFGRTTSVVFSPDGKLLASCNSDTEALVEGTPGLAQNRTEVKVWEIPTGKTLATISPDLKQCNGVAFRADGKTLLVGGGNPFITMKTGAIKELDIASAKVLKETLKAPYMVECLALSADGKGMAWACDDLDGDGPTVAEIVRRAEGRAPDPNATPAKPKQKMRFQVWWTH